MQGIYKRWKVEQKTERKATELENKIFLSTAYC